MQEVFDFSMAIFFITAFVVVAWGMILFHMDEQAEWDARRNYEKMNDNLKEADRNDSSRT